MVGWLNVGWLEGWKVGWLNEEMSGWYKTLGLTDGHSSPDNAPPVMYKL
jgi:hypothetical protein